MLLQATSWKLEEAIQLFFVGNEGGLGASSLYSSPLENNKHPVNQSSRFVDAMQKFLFLICGYREDPCWCLGLLTSAFLCLDYAMI